jgi:hypothetical protein
MIDRRTVQRTNDDMGASYLSWLVVLWLVVGCLMVQRMGFGVLVGSLVRVEHEESTEESKSEVEVREATHKCSRVRIAGLGRDGRNLFVPSLSDHAVSAHRPAVRFAAHLVGSGINLRC